MTTTDITALLQDYLSGNRNPNGQCPQYGLQGIISDNRLEVTLTFFTNKTYCCQEWGCHIDLYNNKPWFSLRQAMGKIGIHPSQSMTLELRVVVEQGAKFIDPFSTESIDRRPYISANAQTYNIQSNEIG
jgi:hypothetical protein